MRLSVRDLKGPGPVTERLCLVLLIPVNAPAGQGSESRCINRQKTNAASMVKPLKPECNLEFPICITFVNLKDLYPRIICITNVEQISVVYEQAGRHPEFAKITTPFSYIEEVGTFPVKNLNSIKKIIYNINYAVPVSRDP